MNVHLVLVAGGCRSGKSSFARRYVEKMAGEKLYLATCPVLDEEMAARVTRHRAEREGGGWTTHEEEIEIARVIAGAPQGCGILIDCLTLWVSNLMYRAEQNGSDMDEDAASRLAEEVAAACIRRAGLTVAVTNEVGMGIVPDNPVARRYRDLSGRVSQAFAAVADEVYLLVCGIPTRIK